MPREQREQRGERGGDRRRRNEDDLLPLQKKGAKFLEGVKVIDYKDSELLRKFMSDRGKITPRRITGTSAKQQREIQAAIRRARVMGLLP